MPQKVLCRPLKTFNLVFSLRPGLGREGLTKYREKDNLNTLGAFVKNFGRIAQLGFIPKPNSENIGTPVKCLNISEPCSRPLAVH